MRKTRYPLITLGVLVATAIAGLAPAAASACTTVKTSKGNMTAAQVGGTVTEALDATGCEIGVYYDESSGDVSKADVHGAQKYGVFVDKDADVNVTNSKVHQIGDNPFSGNQYGVAVYYTDGSSGTVSGNTIYAYQKNGFAATLPGTDVAVNDNVVTGEGSITYIAQNGIEFGFGAQGSAKNNEIDGHWYAGSNWTSTGLLLFDVSAKQVKTSKNKFVDNQTNLAIITAQSCPHVYGGFYDGICLFEP